MQEQGPGWGFMWVWQPWHVDGDLEIYVQGEVFTTFEDARIAALDSGPMHMRAATDGNPSAVSLLRSCQAGQDVLISYEDGKDAFAIYRVAPGQSSRSAGMAFHLHWRETLFEELMAELDNPSGATVWYTAGTRAEPNVPGLQVVAGPARCCCWRWCSSVGSG